MTSLANAKKLANDPSRLDTCHAEEYRVVPDGEDHAVIGPEGRIFGPCSWNLADKLARALERARHDGYVKGSRR